MSSASDTPGRPTFAPVVQGGAGFGGLYEPIDDDTVRRALETAWDAGVRAYDTAPHYGVGLGEERMGSFLAEKPRQEFVLSTKVGRLLVDDPDASTEADGFVGTPRRRRVPDYSADGVRRSIEESLQRMGLDRLDLVLVHDPEDHLDQAVLEAAPALSALRDEGIITGYGVGTNYANVALRMVTDTDLDTVMIAGRYTLLDRAAADDLLSACAGRAVSILAAGVLNSGLLVDPEVDDPYFNYAPAPPHIVAKARRLQETCGRYGVELRAAALQFPTRHPAVSAVVLGARTPQAVADSIVQLGVEIPATLWAELDEIVAAP
ncbi:MAG TPA: aldo/keto reductase [Propionibacteriaceae bacterium]|nr:aldo/keto reductase [Propionibacteriaceae bacterium]